MGRMKELDIDRQNAEGAGMNLEEIKKYHDVNPHVVWLIAEVERLRERKGPDNLYWLQQHSYQRRHREWALKQAKLYHDCSEHYGERAEKAEAEIERTRQTCKKWMGYQRRHRKWALKQCRTWQRYFCFYKDDAVKFHSARADKAEARIEELEQELSWTIDAEQKAEKDVEERDKRIKELEEASRLDRQLLQDREITEHD